MVGLFLVGFFSQKEENKQARVKILFHTGPWSTRSQVKTFKSSQ